MNDYQPGDFVFIVHDKKIYQAQLSNRYAFGDSYVYNTIVKLNNNVVYKLIYDKDTIFYSMFQSLKYILNQYIEDIVKKIKNENELEKQKIEYFTNKIFEINFVINQIDICEKKFQERGYQILIKNEFFKSDKKFLTINECMKELISKNLVEQDIKIFEVGDKQMAMIFNRDLKTHIRECLGD